MPALKVSFNVQTTKPDGTNNEYHSLLSIAPEVITAFPNHQATCHGSFYIFRTVHLYGDASSTASSMSVELAALTMTSPTS
jgi:hypothetical protein